MSEGVENWLKARGDRLFTYMETGDLTGMNDGISWVIERGRIDPEFLAKHFPKLDNPLDRGCSFKIDLEGFGK